MLVSMMMGLNAISQMNNAQFALMNNSRNMMSMCNRLPNFTGSMASLHQMDNRILMNNDVNQTKLMMASVMKQNADQMKKQDMEMNKISYIA